jgi:AcrR family transcriptional regulator
VPSLQTSGRDVGRTSSLESDLPQSITPGTDSDADPARTGGASRVGRRAAARDELASIALPRFFDAGFDNVTFDDLATAARVSRSTFLRYFGSKEDVVLFVFDPLGDAMSAALASRPAAEDEWTALRRAVDPAVALLARDPGAGLALLRLVRNTPALWGRLHEKQASWRAALADRLSERSGTGTPPPSSCARALWLRGVPDDRLRQLDRRRGAR